MHPAAGHWAVAESNPHIEPEPRFAFFAEKVREALPELTVQLQDGIKKSRLDPLSVNTLGEAILVLVLASEESRREVLDDFLARARQRIAQLGADGEKPVQFRQVRMMLGEELSGGNRLTAQQLEMIRAIKTSLQGQVFAQLYDSIRAVEAELQAVEAALGKFDTEHPDWSSDDEIRAMRLPLMTRRTDLTAALMQLRDSAGQLEGVYGLQQAAEAKGLTAAGLQVDLAYLYQVEKPVIAWIGQNHYVVVIAVNQQQVEFTDPDRGRVAIGIADFSKIWDGHILTVCRQGKP